MINDISHFLRIIKKRITKQYQRKSILTARSITEWTESTCMYVWPGTKNVTFTFTFVTFTCLMFFASRVTNWWTIATRPRFLFCPSHESQNTSTELAPFVSASTRYYRIETRWYFVAASFSVNLTPGVTDGFFRVTLLHPLIVNTISIPFPWRVFNTFCRSKLMTLSCWRVRW